MFPNNLVQADEHDQKQSSLIETGRNEMKLDLIYDETEQYDLFIDRYIDNVPSISDDQCEKSYNINYFPEFSLPFLKPEDVVSILQQPLDMQEGNSDYSPNKELVEKYYAKINQPHGYINIHSGELVQMQHVIQHVQVRLVKKKKKVEEGDNPWEIKKIPFFKLWKLDPTMRQYEGLGWYPPPFMVPSHYFNIFKAERYHAVIRENQTKDASLLIDFFQSIICNDDQQTEQFLCEFIYHLLKFPGFNPELFIVFYSEGKGSGKNAFGRLIAALCNNQYVEEIQGNTYFEQQFTGKNQVILIILSELTDHVSGKMIEKIKSKITNETVQVNVKFQPLRNMINCIRYLCMVNNFNVFSQINSTRRFAFFEVDESRINDEQYWQTYHEMIRDNDIIRGFWRYIVNKISNETKRLMARKLYNFQQKIPKTSYYKELMYRNMEKKHIFLAWILFKIYKIREPEHLKFERMKVTRTRRHMFSDLRSNFYTKRWPGDTMEKLSYPGIVDSYSNIKHKKKKFMIKVKSSNHYFECDWRILYNYYNKKFPHFMPLCLEKQIITNVILSVTGIFQEWQG